MRELPLKYAKTQKAHLLKLNRRQFELIKRLELQYNLANKNQIRELIKANKDSFSRTFGNLFS